MNWSEIKYFKREEFLCPCCKEEHMDFKFVKFLDDMRDHLGFPIKILSGWRCKKHNREVGGKENSSHLYGLAADIKCTNDKERAMIIMYIIAKSYFCFRVGIGKNFIHIDIDNSKPQPRVWTYYGK